MSGHSKWSTIKHKKGLEDAKRGKVFSQLSKNIRMAVKEGKSGDPAGNATLRLAIEKAKAENMPKENIQRAIDRGLGKGKSGSIQEIHYEGFGPGGVGLIIVVLTDNTQRTSGEIRNLLHRAGGSLGSPGSASYLFHKNPDTSYTAQIKMPLSEAQKGEIENLLDELRGHDDVEDIYVAADIE